MLYQDNNRSQDHNRDNNRFEPVCWERIAPDANLVFSGGIRIEPVRDSCPKSLDGENITRARCRVITDTILVLDLENGLGPCPGLDAYATAKYNNIGAGNIPFTERILHSAPN